MAQPLRRVETEPNLFVRMFRAWDRFFFAPADPTPLAVVRICGGLLILYVHLCYSFDLQTFLGKHAWVDLETVTDLRLYSPVQGLPLSWTPPQERVWTEEELEYYKKWGVNPQVVVAQGNWRWSIWFHVTDPTWMWLIHGGILLAMLCLTLGFCTRVAAVLTWVGMLSYTNRAITSLFGMDAIMSMIALYLMIGPSGAVLSVDNWLARRRARTNRDLSQPALAWPPPPLISANLALRLMQIHLCVIYAASGISKLQGSTWWSGTAVWGTMANYEFSPMNYKLYMDYLRFLAEHRWLWELTTTGSTAFTLAFEIGFPFLIWLRPTRWLMIVSAVFLHLGIAFFMGLVGFSTIMIVAVLSFIPAEVYQWGLDRLELWWPGAPGSDGPARNLVLESSSSGSVKLSRSA